VDDWVAVLVRHGIDAVTAERLIAFVPMACAHSLLPALGVQLQATYPIVDLDTNRSWRGALSDEPIFVAALTLASEAIGSSRADWVHIVAAWSSEWNVASKFEDNPNGCIVTEPILVRVPLPDSGRS
jgi:hypothetical protein